MSNCNEKKSTVVLVFLLGFLCACQPSSDTPKERWQHAVEGAYAADISNDGQYSVVSSIHHGVALWSIKDNALKYQWSQQADSSDNLVLAADISDNNSHAFIASKLTFSLWNIETGQSEGYWTLSDSTIRDIAVSNNGNHFLIGKTNGKVEHVTIDTGRRLEFLGHKEKINAVDMLPNGRVAMSGGNDYVAYVWDTLSGQPIYKFNHASRVTQVSLDPNGKYAFSADSQKAANIWSLATGKLVSQLQLDSRQEVFSALAFSKDGKKLVTGAPSRKVSVWDVATGKRLSSWRVSPRDDIRPAGAVVYSVAFSDNNHILTESSSGYAELWPMPK